MAELQRSVTSFRRQGSSGLVWNDKFLSGLKDLNQPNPNQQETDPRPIVRSRSAGARPYRMVTVAPPPKDPPSPKVAACGGFCGLFGKPVAASATHQSNSMSMKRR